MMQVELQGLKKTQVFRQDVISTLPAPGGAEVTILNTIGVRNCSSAIPHYFRAKPPCNHEWGEFRIAITGLTKSRFHRLVRLISLNFSLVTDSLAMLSSGISVPNWSNFSP
jgi:hypothetical protein